MSATAPLRSLRRDAPAALAAPPPPAGLSARGRRRWRDLWAEYGFSPAAADLLGQALGALDLADDCARRIRVEGLVLEGRYAGVPRAHPLLAVRRDAARTAERIYRALGLSRADEGRASEPGGGRMPGQGREPVAPTPRAAGLLRAVGSEEDEP